MLEHGGHLLEAAMKYNIPKDQWLDLSTGINPQGYLIPPIPAECWQRLPESADNLVSAAKQYYQCDTLLPIAGSQAAIQTLPYCRGQSVVGVLSPAYAEHGYNWKQAGHQVIQLTSQTINNHLDQLDVLILINPNNPTGERFSKDQLLSWHDQLTKKNGWLIIDEAFIDSTPEDSLTNHPITDGLIILRSVGKFFGLAGIRCGFIITTDKLLNSLNERLGPWTISHPSRYIATAALLDTQWQKKTQSKLQRQSTRLANLLTESGLKPDGQTHLFHWVKTSKAQQIHNNLAQQAVLTRLFEQPYSLRFGLPCNNSQWHHLEKSLEQLFIFCNYSAFFNCS